MAGPTSIANPNHKKEQRKQKFRTDQSLPHGKKKQKKKFIYILQI